MSIFDGPPPNAPRKSTPVRTNSSLNPIKYIPSRILLKVLPRIFCCWRCIADHVYHTPSTRVLYSTQYVHVYVHVCVHVYVTRTIAIRVYVHVYTTTSTMTPSTCSWATARVTCVYVLAAEVTWAVLVDAPRTFSFWRGPFLPPSAIT